MPWWRISSFCMAHSSFHGAFIFSWRIYLSTAFIAFLHAYPYGADCFMPAQLEKIAHGARKPMKNSGSPILVLITLIFAFAIKFCIWAAFFFELPFLSLSSCSLLPPLYPHFYPSFTLFTPWFAYLAPSGTCIPNGTIQVHSRQRCIR